MNIFKWLFGSKKEKEKKPHPHEDKGCDFGHKEFNKTKRTKEFVEELNMASRGKGKPPKPPKPNKTTTTTTTNYPWTTTTTTEQPWLSTTTTTTIWNSTTTTTTNSPSRQDAVVLLDFNGHVVSNTSWNVFGSIDCEYAGMTEPEIEATILSIMEDYSAYNLTITTDENVFYAAPSNRRVRCIFTETHEWFGNGAGGVAFLDSFWQSADNPCFVFTSLLGYNTKYIREAAAHEIGHTLGLKHQANWDANCVKVSDYYTGANGEAPIMGVGYYQPDVHWWVGPTPDGCHSIQDDHAILASRLGLK